MSEVFLPGVPQFFVRQALDRASGNELASGKFSSPESSAALAVNGFGWFIERPALLPPFPDIDDRAKRLLRIPEDQAVVSRRLQSFIG